MELTSGPLTYTVEEAARLLRIGRTTAYALAKEWRATGGRSGLPVLELGRSLRVPRAALARLLDPAVPVGGDHASDAIGRPLP
ncbi:MAG TPA: helix-turn-helix domain-containing protein [Nocardioides sp.]